MTRHSCPVCRQKHDYPKAHRAPIAILWALLFTVVEVIAALALDGPLSWALWTIAARNVLVVILVIVGLSQMAAEKATDV